MIPASGLAVVGALLGKSDFAKKLNRMDVTKNRSQHQIKNGDIGGSLRETILNENVAALIDEGCYFIIKRNLRRENKDGWFEIAKQYGQDVTTPTERVNSSTVR